MDKIITLQVDFADLGYPYPIFAMMEVELLLNLHLLSPVFYF
jgi:hypothetical protein